MTGAWRIRVVRRVLAMVTRREGTKTIMAKMGVLGRAMASIRQHPEHHNQHEWHNAYGATTETRKGNGDAPGCGTTLCLAGWIAFNEAPRGSKLRGSEIELPSGTEEEIEVYAGRAAGLSTAQREALFLAVNADAEGLQRGIDVLALNPDADYTEIRSAVNGTS